MRQYLVLVRLFVQCARRRNVAFGGFRARCSMVVVWLFYALIQVIIAIALADTGNVVASAFLLYTFHVVLIMMSCLVFDPQALLDPSDVSMLVHHPLHPASYVAARVTAVVLYYSTHTVVVNAPAGLVLGWTLGSVWFPIAFVIAASLSTIGAVSLSLVLLVGLLRMVGKRRLGDLLPFVQIVLILGTAIALHLIFEGHLNNLSAIRALLVTDAAAFLPSTWSAFGVAALAVPESFIASWVAWRGVVASALVLLLMLLWCGRMYVSVLQALAYAEERHQQLQVGRIGRLQRVVEGCVHGCPVAIAGLRLVWPMLTRSPDLKMRLYPALAFPLLMGVVHLMQSDPDTALLGAMVPLMLAIWSSHMVSILEVSSEHEAGWLVHVTPADELSLGMRGACVALVWKLGAPTALIYGLIIMVLGSLDLALSTVLHALGLLAVGLALSHLDHRQFPLTRQPVKLRADLVHMCMMAGVGIVTLIVQALLRLMSPWLPLLAGAGWCYLGLRALTRPLRA